MAQFTKWLEELTTKGAELDKLADRLTQRVEEQGAELRTLREAKESNDKISNDAGAELLGRIQELGVERHELRTRVRELDERERTHHHDLNQMSIDYKLAIEDIKRVVLELLNDYSLGDQAYAIREGLDLPADFEGSTWHHPKVTRFGEIVAKLREFTAATHRLPDPTRTRTTRVDLQIDGPDGEEVGRTVTFNCNCGLEHQLAVDIRGTLHYRMPEEETPT